MNFSNKENLKVNEVAVYLGISNATVRNWIKSDDLQIKSNSNFSFQEIKKIKENLKNGSFQKLKGRANKSENKKTFIPDEYAVSNFEIEKVEKIVDFVMENKIDLEISIFLLTLNFLKQENLLENLIDFNFNKKIVLKNKQITEEINSWKLKFIGKNFDFNYSFLLNFNLPKQRDVLGFLYQSLLNEGKKSKNGSYYTPKFLVDKIVENYVKENSKVLDPCCGTGQFLLAFSDVVKNPKDIYGIDFDEIAVRIARINLLVKYKNIDFAPNIVCKNTLLEIGNFDLFSLNDENIRDFDVIATNPPWGVHFSKTDLQKLENFYPQIKSLESFSYFIKKSIDLLSEKGILSFILPESILNVKVHKDIREIILKETKIKKVFYLNRIFKNVFSPVIRLDLIKDKNYKEEIEIIKEKESFKISQDEWKNNKDFIFSIHANNLDSKIIEKVYSFKHETLQNKADWALGIVTGNNEKYISTEFKKNLKPIFKGRDVDKFTFKEPTNFIDFFPAKFQQMAPVEKYEAKEKLVYRFISKNLVFAYDDKQRLTLNSANVVIPKLENYPIKVIVALFNSSLYQFIFQKKFASIKVLRNHIEQLPLPIWKMEVFNKIVKMVDEILIEKGDSKKLDNYIFDQFSFTKEEIDYVKNFVK